MLVCMVLDSAPNPYVIWILGQRYGNAATLQDVMPRARHNAMA